MVLVKSPFLICVNWLFRIPETGVLGVTKFLHQGSPYVCFLLKGDTASPILYTYPTE